MARPKEDLTGQRFGRLTVLAEDRMVKVGAARNYYLVCQCDCGKIVSVRKNDLKGGKVKSCGCLRRENGHRLTDRMADEHPKRHPGIYRMPHGKYKAVITVNGEYIHLGVFDTMQQAEEYREKELQRRKEEEELKW